jgi:hypothetical protein
MPEAQQYHYAFIDAALTEPAWPGFFTGVPGDFSGLPAAIEREFHHPLPGIFDFSRNLAVATETRAPDRRGLRMKAGRRSDETQE